MYFVATEHKINEIDKINNNNKTHKRVYLTFQLESLILKDSGGLFVYTGNGNEISLAN